MGSVRQPPDGRDDVRPEGDVGDEVAVHDVEVDPVDAGAFQLADDAVEVPKSAVRMLAATWTTLCHGRARH